MNTSNSKLNARLQQKSNEGSPAHRSQKVRKEEQAAIEIQREEHEMKADPKDVLKAVFMWKDDPQERANGS